jgi:amino acid transporter
VFKLPLEVVIVLVMTTLNIRGVREAVMPLVPVFLLFVATHLIIVVAGIATNLWEFGPVAHRVTRGYSQGMQSLGAVGMLALFARAYSLGGGTYTGIEAVSNGLPIMREPRVKTARRTMVYMAVSLAFTAAGLLLCYLLVDAHATPGKTLNAVLTERLVRHVPGGSAFVIATLVSEGALLVVGAQAGFIDGPRVLANMALDGWAPRRFSMLSDRLTSQNGIFLMGGASMLALLYTRGDVGHLVVMYSINVFLTFSLSMAGMLRSSISHRREFQNWPGRALLFTIGLLLCATILVVTSIEKFREGGWLTLLVTALFVAVCAITRAHYRAVSVKLRQLDTDLGEIPGTGATVPPLEPKRPTGVVLVGGYNGLGVHTVLNLFRSFKNYYKNLVFVSAGVIDTGAFKGKEEVAALRESTEASLKRYVELAAKLGVPATWRCAVGTDAVDEIEKICLEVTDEFPDVTYFAGQIIFQRERWWQGVLHNQTAYAVQKRLQWAGRTMVILPVRLR